MFDYSRVYLNSCCLVVNSVYDLNGDTQWEYHSHCEMNDDNHGFPIPEKNGLYAWFMVEISMLKEHLNTCLTYQLSKFLDYMCCQAIADLSKALEFEPNSSDILHERGTPFIFCQIWISILFLCLFDWNGCLWDFRYGSLQIKRLWRSC